MTTFLLVGGSPSRPSRTAVLLDDVAAQLEGMGHTATRLEVLDLPAAALLRADTTDLALQAAVAEVDLADALVIATPVYKASYSGLFKAFLDVLPQRAFAGKSVLPLVTGGTIAHLLSIDYALRPVLLSLGPPPHRVGTLRSRHGADQGRARARDPRSNSTPGSPRRRRELPGRLHAPQRAPHGVRPAR